jgi:hypothetical protein
MVVRLSDGGKLELGEGQSVVRLDRRGQVIEVLRPGDSCYWYWLGLVRPGHAEKRESGRPSEADGG